MGARILTVLPTRVLLAMRHLAFATAVGVLGMTTGCLAQTESQAADRGEQVGEVGSDLNEGQTEIVVVAPPGGGGEGQNGPEPDPWHTRALGGGGPEPDPWHPTGSEGAASGASGANHGGNGSASGTGKN